VGPSSVLYGAAGPSHNSYSSPVSSWGPQGEGKHSQKRPSNRDEFDGPCQFLQRPPTEYIAQQERDLPHLPSNLVAHEQDNILLQVNDRLSRCAFDFVAKYQFPIPLANGEMRPVEWPQDREWTEWVYLLKRLATKRRIPARVSQSWKTHLRCDMLLSTSPDPSRTTGISYNSFQPASK
jgi:hypothetical protein